MTRAAEYGARRIALMVAMLSTMTAFLIALTPGPARADCGLLGTSCVTDTVEQTAGGAASTVQETVDHTVDNVNDTVHAVDPVAPPPPDGHSEQGANDPSGGGSRPDTEPAVVRPDRPNRSAPTLEQVALVSGTSPARDTVIVTGTVSTSPFDPLGPFAG